MNLLANSGKYSCIEREPVLFFLQLRLADFKLSVSSVWERSPQLHHEDIGPNTSDYATSWIFPAARAACSKGKGCWEQSVTRPALLGSTLPSPALPAP